MSDDPRGVGRQHHGIFCVGKRKSLGVAGGVFGNHLGVSGFNGVPTIIGPCRRTDQQHRNKHGNS